MSSRSPIENPEELPTPEGCKSFMVIKDAQSTDWDSFGEFHIDFAIMAPLDPCVEGKREYSMSLHKPTSSRGSEVMLN